MLGRKDEDLLLQVGRFELVLPPGHLAPTYRNIYKLYDFNLGEIASLVVRKYRDATAIDIGANVGDTAAVLCRDHDVPVLCVEGHPAFLRYLKKNIARLPSGTELAECLVGRTRDTVPVGPLHEKVERRDWTPPAPQRRLTPLSSTSSR